MHADVEALWPFLSGNSVQGVISLDALQEACIASAVLALAIWTAIKHFKSYSNQP